MKTEPKFMFHLTASEVVDIVAALNKDGQPNLANAIKGELVVSQYRKDLTSRSRAKAMKARKGLNKLLRQQVV